MARKRRTKKAGRTKSSGAKPSKARSRRVRKAKPPAYLKKLNTAVRAHFAAAADLPSFLSTAGTLTAEQRKLLVRQALILLEQNYAHLPLKRAMHAVDPVQRLKLLLQVLEHTPVAALPPEEELQREIEFHREMTDIFTSVRDLHTNYLLPAPFNQMSAFLPFMVEDCFAGGRRSYIVSHVAPGFAHPTFVPGVEVLHWNGTPIERAVLNHAQRYAGSNREARHARGVQTLTTRALAITPPPDEVWVIVGYRTLAGEDEELRVDWMVNPPLPTGNEPSEDDGDLHAVAAMGLDLEQELIQRTRRALFAPEVVAAARKATARRSRGAAVSGLTSTLPGVFEARSVTTPAGTFGYVRIRTFNVAVSAFVEEFIRLTSALPQNGLILDVRGNGGGIIMNGELILQLLTPRRIEPEPVQFLATPLNLEICRRHGAGSNWTDLSAWVESMEQALQTGAAYSSGFPITDPDQCNVLGQTYFGPVVLITDALCYSTTDIFAAGFQDHEIGLVLGADGNTGAGGANVWQQQHFVQFVVPGSGSPYKPLPNGAGMRVSIRRTIRVGRRAGSPLEDLGVVPDDRHFMTRDDLLHENVDLINKAGSMLASLPLRELSVEVQATSPNQATVIATTQGITRLDAYLDDRPIQSVDVQSSPTTLSIAKPGPPPATLELRAFDGTELVGRYRTSF